MGDSKTSKEGLEEKWIVLLVALEMKAGWMAFNYSIWGRDYFVLPNKRLFISLEAIRGRGLFHALLEHWSPA